MKDHTYNGLVRGSLRQLQRDLIALQVLTTAFLHQGSAKGMYAISSFVILCELTPVLVFILVILKLLSYYITCIMTDFIYSRHTSSPSQYQDLISNLHLP